MNGGLLGSSADGLRDFMFPTPPATPDETQRVQIPDYAQRP